MIEKKGNIEDRIKKVCAACRNYLFDYYDLSDRVVVRHTVIKKRKGIIGKPWKREVKKLIFRIEIEMESGELKAKPQQPFDSSNLPCDPIMGMPHGPQEGKNA